MPNFVHGRQTRILLDNYDVSRYFREVTRANSADQVDTTTFGAGSDKSYIAGWKESGVTLGGLFESSTQIGATASDTMDKYLSTILGRENPNLLLAIGWEGFALGKPVSIFEGTELGYETSSPIGDVTAVSLSLSSEGPSMQGKSLHDIIATENATGSGSSVDNGAASANGGVAQLHVPANTRDGSDNGVGDAWADIATFTAVGASTLASERIVVPDGTTVKRYLRASWTVAGASGAITFNVSFARS
jgi:hypothetical protein